MPRPVAVWWDSSHEELYAPLTFNPLTFWEYAQVRDQWRVRAKAAGGCGKWSLKQWVCVCAYSLSLLNCQSKKDLLCDGQIPLCDLVTDLVCNFFAQNLVRDQTAVVEFGRNLTANPDARFGTFLISECRSQMHVSLLVLEPCWHPGVRKWEFYMSVFAVICVQWNEPGKFIGSWVVSKMAVNLTLYRMVMPIGTPFLKEKINN